MDHPARPAEKPRMRVELRTPKGTVHRAEESLSTTLTDLLTRADSTRDKHDLMRAAEGLADLGSRVVLKLAHAFVRSFRKG